MHGQTHRPMELIVVDDSSPDHTGEVAEDLARVLTEPGFEVRVVHHPANLGGAGALVTGFGIARGDYVCWLSADDAYVCPEKTARQIQVMAAGADLSYSSVNYWGDSAKTGESVEIHWSGRSWVRDEWYLENPLWCLLSLNIGNPINGSSVMIRRETLQRLGTFDASLRNIDQDGDLWLRLSALGARFTVVEGASVFYRIHPGQTTNQTEAVDWGCALTRARVLLALREAAALGHVLDRAWPALLLARPGGFAFFSLVSQTLCHLGLESGCGPIPRLILHGLKWQLRRRGHWDEARVKLLLQEAAVSAQSEEFARFVRLLPSSTAIRTH